jgi:hypothetical protein
LETSGFKNKKIGGAFYAKKFNKYWNSIGNSIRFSFRNILYFFFYGAKLYLILIKKVTFDTQ